VSEAAVTTGTYRFIGDRLILDVVLLSACATVSRKKNIVIYF
jgi:hypothetical protein